MNANQTSDQPGPPDAPTSPREIWVRRTVWYLRRPCDHCGQIYEVAQRDAPRSRYCRYNCRTMAARQRRRER